MRKLILLIALFVMVCISIPLLAWNETCYWQDPWTRVCCGVDSSGTSYCVTMTCSQGPSGDYNCVDVDHPS